MPNEFEVAAKRIVEQGEGPWPDADWTVLVSLTERAIASLGWRTMNYKCEKCGFEWAVYLTLGCEGPPELKEKGLALAVPFVAGRCPSWPGMKTCDGSMQHVRFADDQTFFPRLIPDDAPRFVLPTTSAGGEGGAPCGRLEIPMPALVRARRFWNEQKELKTQVERARRAVEGGRLDEEPSA